MNTEKTLGYILLTIGIVVILGSAFNVYQVFTGSIRPVQIFNFSGISLDLAPILTEGNARGNSELSTELIQKNIINDPANLAAHMFFMGFIGSTGARLAGIGATLVRPIVIKANSEDKFVKK